MRKLKLEQIAIIDNGVSEKFIGIDGIGYKIFIDDDNHYRDDYGETLITDFQHGTICALIIKKYNTNCILNSIRILDKDGSGKIEKIAPALEWCYQHGIRVVNLSFGTTHFNECDRLKRLVNKYAYKGLVIVSAIANSGFVSYPASFTNVIGVVTTNCPLNYFKDYMQLGIDAVVPSEHIVKMCNEEIVTILSNSYATPYISSCVIRKLSENNTLDIFGLKKYVKEEKSYIEMTVGVHEPDWIYKACMLNGKKDSRAEYYFEVVEGELSEIWNEIDTVIAFSISDLQNIELKNKNLVYLGKEDISGVCTKVFFWNSEVRRQQILNNHYNGNNSEVPIVILEMEYVDIFYVLTELRESFANAGYNAYVIGMKTESVLYGIEYMPEPNEGYEIWKNFINSQVFYKQSDLVICCVSPESKEKILKIYPDCDVEISVRNEGQHTLVRFYFQDEEIKKNISGLIDKEDIEDIYHIIENKLVEGEHER